MKHQLLILLFSLFILCGFSDAALAHAIETDYAFDLIRSELAFTSTFSNGEAVAGAEVKIYAPNSPEQPWAEAVMDEQGNFSFLPDTSMPGEWKIQIKQEGHEDIWVIPVNQNQIEFDKISRTDQSDLHYAQYSRRSWQAGLLGVSLGTLLYLGLNRKMARLRR